MVPLLRIAGKSEIRFAGLQPYSCNTERRILAVPDVSSLEKPPAHRRAQESKLNCLRTTCQ
eukprot:scaffold52064_cov19-Tisochrysis_lutea.AAC.2